MATNQPATKAKLTAKDGKGFLEFDYNPTSIRMARQTVLQERAINVDSDIGAVGTLGKKKLTLSNLTLSGGKEEVGGDVGKRVEKLLAWSSPIITTTEDENQKSVEDKKLPQLTFKWGEYFDYEVELYDVNCEYTRFTNNGKPTRASVTLTLHVISINSKPGTNPTSGGLPDRSAHIVIDGDSLPSLAQATYGDPNLWRRVAAINGIEDPLRLAPGDRVYLPGASELLEGAP